MLTTSSHLSRHGLATPAVTTARGEVLDREPDPDRLTCAELSNRDNYTVVYDTAFTMARRNPVRGSMNDLCQRRDNPSYHPAADALAR